MGKKSSFICSQTDSLTGVKRPANLFWPVHSYTKWDRAPNVETRMPPVIRKSFKLLFIFIIHAFLQSEPFFYAVYSL